MRVEAPLAEYTSSKLKTVSKKGKSNFVKCAQCVEDVKKKGGIFRLQIEEGPNLEGKKGLEISNRECEN